MTMSIAGVYTPGRGGHVDSRRRDVVAADRRNQVVGGGRLDAGRRQLLVPPTRSRLGPASSHIGEDDQHRLVPRRRRGTSQC